MFEIELYAGLQCKQIKLVHVISRKIAFKFSPDLVGYDDFEAGQIHHNFFTG